MSYWIWDPHVPDEARGAVQFILTPSDAGPPSTSKAFATQLLEDLKVKATVKSCQLETFRSRYFTDYPDSKDWRDKWQIVWRYRIFTRSRRVQLSIRKRETETQAFSGKRMPIVDGPSRAGCLVVADFATERTADMVVAAMAGSEEIKAVRRKLRVRPPRPYKLAIRPHYVQLQFDLGRFPGDFFESGAGYAAAIESICVKKRATLHFDDRVA